MNRLSCPKPRLTNRKPSYPRIALSVAALVAAFSASACGAAQDVYDRDAGPYDSDAGDGGDAADAQIDSGVTPDVGTDSQAPATADATLGE